MRNRRYALLDGIRGLAAIFIMTRHTGTFWHILFYRSYLAVDLFFLLSGFVIAHAYGARLKGGEISAIDFMVLRIIRLYPMYFLSLILCLAVVIGGVFGIGDQAKLNNEVKVFLMAALFIPSGLVYGGWLFPINGPYWSLMFELVVNGLYAIVAPVLTITIMMVIVMLSGAVVIAVSIIHGSLNIGFSSDALSIVAGLSRAIFGIFLGVFMYLNYERVSGVLKKLVPPWILMLVIGLVLVSPDFRQFNSLIDIVVVLVVFPAVVLCAADASSSRFDKFFLYIGSASYPIYVIHLPTGELVSLLLGGAEGIYAPWGGVLLLLLLLVFSVWIERVYDMPIRRWLNGCYRVFRGVGAVAN